jgi:hypothetical protein
LGIAEFSRKGGTIPVRFGFTAQKLRCAGRTPREGPVCLAVVRQHRRAHTGGEFSLAEKTDKKPTAAPSKQKRPEDPQMGQALRSVYQKTVEEAVPDEMLDLLSKLD